MFNNPSPTEQKQAELARSLSIGTEQILAEAMLRKGYPIEAEYIKAHCSMQRVHVGLDRFYHDEQLFLEIVTEWDNSDPMAIKTNLIPTLY